MIRSRKTKSASVGAGACDSNTGGVFVYSYDNTKNAKRNPQSVTRAEMIQELRDRHAQYLAEAWHWQRLANNLAARIAGLGGVV